MRSSRASSSLDDEVRGERERLAPGRRQFRRLDHVRQAQSAITVDDLIHGRHHPVGQRRLHHHRRRHGGHRGDLRQSDERRRPARSASPVRISPIRPACPIPTQYMTARDLASSPTTSSTQFPEFYKIYGEPEFTWNKIKQRNRNPLLDMNIGADGLKTGFTDEAGYGLVGSAVRDGQRLIVVIAGTKSEKERARGIAQAARMGLSRLRAGQPFRQGRGRSARPSVFGGAERNVGLVSKTPLDLLLPRGSRDSDQGADRLPGPGAGAGRGRAADRHPPDHRRRRPQQGGAALRRRATSPVGSMRQRALDGLQELVLGWW